MLARAAAISFTKMQKDLRLRLAPPHPRRPPGLLSPRPPRHPGRPASRPPLRIAPREKSSTGDSGPEQAAEDTRFLLTSSYSYANISCDNRQLADPRNPCPSNHFHTLSRFLHRLSSSQVLRFQPAPYSYALSAKFAFRNSFPLNHFRTLQKCGSAATLFLSTTSTLFAKNRGVYPPTPPADRPDPRDTSGLASSIRSPESQGFTHDPPLLACVMVSSHENESRSSLRDRLWPVRRCANAIPRPGRASSVRPSHARSRLFLQTRP